MIPIPRELAQETRCYGTINGKNFELLGGGRGLPYGGKVNTFLKSTKGPVHFPMHLLDVIVIMGYPTFSKYQKGCYDLFKISDGYEYERHIRFQDGGTLDSLHKIRYFGEKLAGDFHVQQGKVSAPELAGIEPIVETFLPAGPGKIRSNFLVAWNVRGGGLFTAVAESEYRLTHNAELPFVQFRHISFETKHSQECLDQAELLTVIRNVSLDHYSVPVAGAGTAA